MYFCEECCTVSVLVPLEWKTQRLSIGRFLSIALEDARQITAQLRNSVRCSADTALRLIRRAAIAMSILRCASSLAASMISAVIALETP